MLVAVILLSMLSGCTTSDEGIFDDPPVVLAIEPDSARAGEEITISGTGFSADQAQNIVYFTPCSEFSESCSRIAQTVSGCIDELVVQVPEGAFSGHVRVETSGLFSEANIYGLETPPLLSNPMPFGINMAQGDIAKVFFGGGTYHFTLSSGSSSEEYLIILFNSATPHTRTQQYNYELYNPLDLSQESRPVHSIVPPAAEEESQALLRRMVSRNPDHELLLLANQGESAYGLKRRIREETVDLLERTGIDRTRTSEDEDDRSAFEGQKAPPQVVSFDVLENPEGYTNDPANFTVVQAELKFTGEHTLLYVDTSTHADCISDAEAAELGRVFDLNTYPTNQSSLGSESDINSDGKVAILLTPVVNLMTPAGTANDGFIAGFFLPGDLLPGLVDPRVTNGMEIFYSFVPDPTGHYGNVFDKERSLDAINAVLAHEFSHMIMFNYRVLIFGSGRSGAYMEDMWLDEGIAHIAEDLNNYDESNIARANLFLENPGNVTLIHGGDTLEERGASFLFLRYLGDRYGDYIFRVLVQSKAAGTANIENATGERFMELFSEWIAACYFSSYGVASDSKYLYTSLDLENDFLPLVHANVNFAISDAIGTVKSMGPEYILTSLPPLGELSLIASGESGGSLHAVIVRTR